MTRIIAGSARGQRLRTPAGDRTRPTSDRVREALFSALEAELGTWQGVGFLDLFAGSGAVGLEALSRGAERLLAVESHRRTARVVADNASALGLRVRVEDRPVHQVLADSPSSAFDVVFADPPYDLGEEELADVLLALTRGWLAADAVVVVERSTRSPAPPWPAGLEPLRSRRYGETTLHYAGAAPQQEPDAEIEEQP